MGSSDIPRLDTTAGTRLELLMLAVGDAGCVAVDLLSGAFVRGRWPTAFPPVDPSVDDLVRLGFVQQPAVDLRAGGPGGAEVVGDAGREVDLTEPDGADVVLGYGDAAGPAGSDEAGAPPGLASVARQRESERIPELVLAGAGAPETAVPGTLQQPDRRSEPAAAPVDADEPAPKSRRERRRPLEPLCLATATVGSCDEAVPDPARPEAVVFEQRPRRFPKSRPRLARRYLGGLLAPANQPLLGFPAPAVRYWDLDSTRGSVAVVEVRGGPVLIRRPEEGELVRARFEWGGLRHELPVLDSRLVGAMLTSERVQLSGTSLHRRLGWWPRYLVVALTGPRDGYCYRVVASALRQP